MTRKGFTLIELLVSVAVITTLISVLVPALSGAKRHSMRVACQSNLRQMQQSLWSYSIANDARVPYVLSPMTNGGSVPGFGKPTYTDAQVNPYDRELWPLSFQNLMMPLYLGDERKLFTCPAANRGWPRQDAGLEMSYRDAGVNQPNGIVTTPKSYLRESFGFMDGRPMNEFRPIMTGNAIIDGQTLGAARGAFMRDMILREGPKVIGPHDGGINVITREFGIEFRDQETAQNDLAPFGTGVEF